MVILMEMTVIIERDENFEVKIMIAIKIKYRWLLSPSLFSSSGIFLNSFQNENAE